MGDHVPFVLSNPLVSNKVILYPNSCQDKTLHEDWIRHAVLTSLHKQSFHCLALFVKVCYNTKN